MMRVYRFITLIAFTVLILEATPTLQSPFEVDNTSIVYRVIDGDTFDASIGRVRLADINTPEAGEPGYYDAKYALSSLVLNRVVYLDVDDKYVKDKYGRYVCVVYVRHNSTHLLNVNLFLVVNGYASIINYDNEFNPYMWRLFIYYPEAATQTETVKTTTLTKTITEARILTTTLTVIQPTTTLTTTLTETITSALNPLYILGVIVALVLILLVIFMFKSRSKIISL
jgi:endonuclease YncB( thermonuclease family)